MALPETIGRAGLPVHPELRTLIRRLVRERSYSYPLRGLTETKYGDRSNAIGKLLEKI